MRPHDRYNINRHPEHQYLDLLRELIDAPPRQTRNDTATRSVFGRTMRFDLEKGFPLLTTKRVPFRLIAAEALWFLSGSTNINVLREQNVGIWDEWSDVHGNLGPVYGHQFRNFGGKHPNRHQRKPQLDPRFSANVLGVAFGGNVPKSLLTDTTRKLYDTWWAMIARCYHPSHDAYPFYGARGVSVCDRWLVFPQFAEDVTAFDSWPEKAASWADYELDKDIYGDGFTYSPTHCDWVTVSANRREKYPFVHVVRHDGTGETAVIDYPVAFYRARDLHQGNFCSMLRGERDVAEGWRLVSTEPKGLGIDQVAQVLQGLRDDPHGRRHVMTLWNPSDLPDMALPPCHGIAIQFYVGADERLSLFMHQRSGDAFLGVPFNIASYALLLEMFASVLGRRPGEFVHSIGDLHLYGNHVEQAQQQVLREPRPLPRLVVDMEARRDDMDSWTLDDIRLFDYDPWPKIAGEVSA